MSLDYGYIFSQIDKAKKKKWTQADTDKWTKQQKKDREKKPKKQQATTEKVPFEKPEKYTKRQTRSDAQRDKLFGTTTISTQPVPEHISRQKLNTKQLKRRSRNRRLAREEAKRKKQEEKEKKQTYTGVKHDYPKHHRTSPRNTAPDREVSRQQEQKERRQQETAKLIAPFKKDPIRQAKIVAAQRKRRKREKLEGIEGFNQWKKDQLEAKEQKTSKKEPEKKTQQAVDQEAEYKKQLAAAMGGMVKRKPIVSTGTKIGRRQAGKKKKKEPTQPAPTAAESIGSQEEQDAYDQAMGDNDEDDGTKNAANKSSWKSWLEKKISEPDPVKDAPDPNRAIFAKDEEDYKRRKEGLGGKGGCRGVGCDKKATKKLIAWVRDLEAGSTVEKPVMSDRMHKEIINVCPDCHKRALDWQEQQKKIQENANKSLWKSWLAEKDAKTGKQSPTGEPSSYHGSATKPRRGVRGQTFQGQAADARNLEGKGRIDQRKRTHSILGDITLPNLERGVTQDQDTKPKGTGTGVSRAPRPQGQPKTMHQNRRAREGKGQGESNTRNQVDGEKKKLLPARGRRKEPKRVINAEPRSQGRPKTGKYSGEEWNKLPDFFKERDAKHNPYKKLEDTQRKIDVLSQKLPQTNTGKKQEDWGKIDDAVQADRAKEIEDKARRGIPYGKALQEVKRALNKAKKKKEVKLPQTKIDKPKDWWDHSKVGRQGDIDQKTGRPWWEVATEEKERKEKKKTRGGPRTYAVRRHLQLVREREQYKKEEEEEQAEANISDANKDATSKDEDECPFCDRPRVGGKADSEAMGMFDWLLSSTTQEEYDGRSRAMKQVKNQHEADVAGFHKKYRQGAPNVNFVRGKEKAGEDNTDDVVSTVKRRKRLEDNFREWAKSLPSKMKLFDLLEAEKDKRRKKAEEGQGGMLMGAQRGLGHEGGNKQGSGQSAQITEVIEEELGNESKKKAQNKPIKPQVVKDPNKVMNVVDEEHSKAEQINEKIRDKVESISVKSAYENHEQDEGTDVKPNKQQIPASKPGMDVVKSMYKKALFIKYNNLYKPLNT